MKKPKVFVSSTIFDFKDLRSALKFYLESQGCEVLMSDFTDFPKPLDVHSYDACLQTIESVDYFLLFIGTRIGGWYDEKNKISITRKEYQVAYELHKQGKLKILIFVRNTVMQAKEQRKELARHLEQNLIDEKIKFDIKNHESKFLEDADAIISFVNEVGKVAETKNAINGLNEPPIGNWIHEFRDFEEIAKALQVNIFRGNAINELVEKRILRNELMHFLKSGLIKMQGKAVSPSYAITSFKSKHPIKSEEKLNEWILIPGKSLDPIFWIGFNLMGMKFRSTIIDKMLFSDLFMQYNIEADEIEETPQYRALVKLKSDIDEFNTQNTTEAISLIYHHLPKNRSHPDAVEKVKVISLASYLRLCSRWANIMEISKFLIRSIDGIESEYPNLLPDSPVEGMQEKIDDENPTLEQISEYLLKP